MGAISLGLVMQPEFFRFGKLGGLTAVHMVFLAAIAATIAINLALRVARPAGWLRESVYKKTKLLTRLAELLAAVLFILTESPIVFIAFGLTVFIAVFISAKHAARGPAALAAAEDSSLKISLALFGILTGIPVLTCAAIILWRATPSDAKGLDKLI
jgi:hypothetical protein